MKESYGGGPFRAALIQMNSGADREKNLKKAENMIREAAAEGAGLIMLPETAEYIGPDLREHAFEDPEGLMQFFGNLAEELGIYLHCGSFTENTGSSGGNENKDGANAGSRKPRNTSVIFGPDGRSLAKYSKIHLFDVDVTDGPSFQESASVEPGDHLSLVRTELGCVGMAICYDIRFPQMFRVLSEEGAGIFTVAANFTKATGKAHWETILRARAIENTAYVLACNQCGQKSAFEAYGHSMVIDPWGNILAEAGEGEEIIYAGIAPEEIARVRREMPSLANTRRDLYSLVSCRVEEYR